MTTAVSSLLIVKSKKIIAAFFGLSAMLSGCSKDANDEFARFADQACACKDAACGYGVLHEVEAFAKANRSATGDQEAARRSGKRISTCLISSGVDPLLLYAAIQKL